jgi:hypothetical protein
MRSAAKTIHYPRLDTILMIENAIKKSGGELTKTRLWKSLPRGVIYPTFLRVLDYLEKSNKIIVTKREGHVVWIYADTPALRKLLRESVPAWTASAP